MPKRGELSEWLENQQALGRYTFTRRDVTQDFAHWPNIRRILNRLGRENRVALVKRGFYVIVPPEYRQQGAPPASWFVDSLMDYLQRPYYAGLLTAAALHGAGHHRPQKFQVVTDQHTRDIEANGVRIEFIQNSELAETPTQQKTTETGYVTVSTPEGTAIDLIRYPDRAGGIGNVATVLTELAEGLDTPKLADALRDDEIKVSPVYVQRLGYLLEVVGQEAAATPLASYVEERQPRWTPLLGGGSSTSDRRIERWRLTVREPVTPET